MFLALGIQKVDKYMVVYVCTYACVCVCVCACKYTQHKACICEQMSVKNSQRKQYIAHDLCTTCNHTNLFPDKWLDDLKSN